MHHLRTVVAATVGFALLVLAAGCGGDDPEKPAASPAAATTSTATDGIDKDAFIDEMLAAIDARSSVHLTVKAGLSGSGQADVSYGASGTRIRVEGMLPGGQRSTFVIAGGTVYVQQGGGRYARIGTDDPTYGALLSTFEDVGPHESLAGLAQGIESIAEVGSHLLGGEDVNVYRAFVDPTAATGAFRALAGSNSEAKAMEFTLYVDHDELLRKVEVEVNGQMTEVTLSAWGEPVTLKVPTASELVGR